ncbi:MAG: uracil-DNA glycosylase [Planctomycetota bacterium]
MHREHPADEASWGNMEINQWRIAGAQLIAHLQRSGITRLPQPQHPLPDEVMAWGKQLASVPLVPAEGVVVEAVTSNRTQNQPSSSPSPVAKLPFEMPREVLSSSTPSSSPTRVPASLVSLPTEPTPWTTALRNDDERAMAFQELNEQVQACRRCAEIACRRLQTVFGIGPRTARFVMVGEAPGAEEDRQGEPFVGPAGQLLDKILVATGLNRQDVYIMNTLKCRPPNNRTPTDVEIENCRPFFEAQLEVLQPEYIVCWGAIAARALLKTTESVGRLRGRFFRYHSAKVLVTYHPSYLLRTPEAKKNTWEDMQLLMRDMGTWPPKK